MPVFVLDPRLLQGRFPSRNRAWFLHGCLAELRAALRERGADLVVRAGRPEEELPALAAEVGASAAYFASDVSPFALARDRRVEAALDGAGVEVRRQPGLFVADVGRVRTKDGRPHSVFTPFHRAWERLPRREVHGAPRRLAFPSGVAVGRLPAAPEPEAADPMPPGEQAGRERMLAWLRSGLERYEERHDVLAGGTSELSPYLHFGCVSPRELEQRARDAGGAGAAAFVRQLAWRDFYAHVLLHHPGNTHHAHRREFDRARVGRRRGAARRLARGPHRLPGRRRRDAPAARARLDAQPRPPDRRLVPDQGPPPRLARGRGPLHAPPAVRRRGLQQRQLAVDRLGRRRPRAPSAACTTR